MSSRGDELELPDQPPGCRCASPTIRPRPRDIAARLDITERSAHGIITDLTASGYVIKHKDGRRNRYQIQAHLRCPNPPPRNPAIGEVPAILAGAGARLQLTGTRPG